MNRDSLKHMITVMQKNTTGIKLDIVHEVADDNYAYAWIRMQGTSDGTYGMPKGPFDMTAIEVIKCKDGKAIEHWEFMEAKQLMKMMGNMPPPPAMKDTTSK
jgi:predicted SnoaL-like aldol condensation-catalyzing enzyme